MSALVLAIEKKYWQNVLSKLIEGGVDISHAVVQYRYEGVYNEFFEQNEVEQIDGKNFYRVDDIREMLKQHDAVLDEEMLKRMQKYERDFYILTDRFSYFPRSFKYRKQLWRHSLRYWFGFYADNNIEKVFMSCSPHNASDYVAFNVARELGIETLQAYHTMINDHLLLREHYGEREKVPEDFLVGLNEEDVKVQIPQKLYEEAFKKSNILQMVTSKNDASLGNKKLNKTKVKKRLSVSRFLNRVKRVFFTAPRFKGALALNGVYPPIVRRTLRLYDIPWKADQRKKHDSIAIKPDLSQKYIYFAMHLQPERTSTPEAELFEDHLLAIDILAKSLPEGWKLYVKENPRQFDRKVNLLKGKHFRDSSDYEDILQLPNVEIISQDVPTKDLIANAQIVSTLSGSVGWEALQAGKPVFIFANAWYGACRSCFEILNLDEAKLAIDEAHSKTEDVVRQDILRYLAYMKDKLIVGNMGEEVVLATTEMPYDELVNEAAKGIINKMAV